MKLAYSSNAYMKVSIEEAVRRVAGLGFAAVELMADVPHAWPATTGDEQLAEIRDALTRSQLAISNVHALMMHTLQDFWHPSLI